MRRYTYTLGIIFVVFGILGVSGFLGDMGFERANILTKDDVTLLFGITWLLMASSKGET